MSGLSAHFLVIFLMTTPTKPCTQMSQNICSVLGAQTFICKVYQQVARHKLASQARCKALLVHRWTQRLQSLVRQENTIKKMKALGARSGVPLQKKLRQYKEVWTKCTVARMLEGAKKQPAPCIQLIQRANKGKRALQMCQRLASVACRDLGVKAFYCAAFQKVAKSPGALPQKCYQVLNHWKSTQKKYYKAQEQRMQWMAKLVRKKPGLQRKHAAMKRKAILRMYAQLHKK